MRLKEKKKMVEMEDRKKRSNICINRAPKGEREK